MEGESSAIWGMSAALEESTPLDALLGGAMVPWAPSWPEAPGVDLSTVFLRPMDPGDESKDA